MQATLVPREGEQLLVLGLVRDLKMATKWSIAECQKWVAGGGGSLPDDIVDELIEKFPASGYDLLMDEEEEKTGPDVDLMVKLLHQGKYLAVRDILNCYIE